MDLGPPQRMVSEELEMPLTAIPESDDPDIIARIRQPPQRVPSDGGSTGGLAGLGQQLEGFTFSPLRTASGNLLEPGVAPFEPQPDVGRASPGLPPPSPSPSPPPRAGSPSPVRAGSPSPPLGMVRSGSSSYLSPEPYEPPPPEPVPFGSPPQREPALPPALPVTAGLPQAGLYRPPSQEALELAGALPPQANGIAAASAAATPAATLRESYGGHAAVAAPDSRTSPSSVVGEPATSLEASVGAAGSLEPPSSLEEDMAAAESVVAAAAKAQASPAIVEAAGFAPQTPEPPSVEAAAPVLALPAEEASVAPAEAPQEAEAAEEEAKLAKGAEYIPRDKQTPYMVRKLRSLQKEDWVGVGDIGEDTKPLKTRSQREREEDLQSWKHMDEQPIAAAATAAVQEVDAEPPLGEDFKVHKSRLEQEVEAAAARERSPPPAQHLPSYMRPTANSVTRNQSPRGTESPSGRRRPDAGTPPQGQGLEAVLKRHQSALEAAKGAGGAAYEPVKKAPAPVVPGLGELLSDTGRIQRKREEAARKHAELFKPAPKRAAPAVPGLDEVLVVTKSRLELEKEAAAAAAAAAGEASPTPPRPTTPSQRAKLVAAEQHVRRFAPAAPKLQEPDAFGGQGLGEVCLRHKSALQRNKEASEAAGANSPTARVRTAPRSELHARRKGEEWGGKSLLELQQPHKSRLVREQEAWAKANGKDYKNPRKPIEHARHVQSPGAEPGAPSFMRDTLASTMKHIDMPEPPRPSSALGG